MRGETQFRRRNGFTLIELLVVIAIIAVLIGLLLPAVQKVREAAARLSCQNNMKQIGLACYNYENVNQRFPYSPNYSIGGNRGSWLTVILPYIEQDNLYNALYSSNDPGIYFPFFAVPIKLYYCPSEPRAYPIISPYGLACTDYVAIAGKDYYDGLGIINPLTMVRVTDITDGTSNTIMVGERPPLGANNPNGENIVGAWAVGAIPEDMFSGAAIQETIIFTDANNNSCLGAPPYYFGAGPLNVYNPCSENYLWSNHPGGGNFTIGDGSVRFISYSASAILPFLATRAGGEIVSVP